MRTGRVVAGLVYRRLVDGAMIYDPRDQTVHHLNETAACVWEACQRGASREEAAAFLCRDYEVDPERAAGDVDAIVARFAAARLLAP
ncbi:MAG: PqqD family protein [Candidatus Latescibacterota bacterium]